METVAGAPYPAPLLERAPDDAWAVIDLRGRGSHLHGRAGREGHEELARIVFAYDLAVVAPTFHAAEDLGR